MNSHKAENPEETGRNINWVNTEGKHHTRSSMLSEPNAIQPPNERTESVITRDPGQTQPNRAWLLSSPGW
ncbi:uncharacterized protein N7511_000681 [Penicillium nucicola]|uniref:uncharacterized protein n=1 Tax=Penicillium nucicola TaxID=1850975 RepID=UPI002544E523|nr:uncharacterized protein N7511_000681 [Penicillium nucicola]KAJ5775670.1 hypothetical protein N7511_000681 [Penicillium nucicola]